MHYVIIAISGRSASGKTTLAKKLGDFYGATVLGMDNFYKTIHEMEEEGLVDEKGFPIWDHPEAISWARFGEFMRQVESGGEIQIPVYQKEPGVVTGYRPIEIGGSIIFEGMYSLHPKANLHHDLGIYIDLPVEEQWNRKFKRDSKFRDPENVRYFWENHTLPLNEKHVQPTVSRAHLIVSGEDIDSAFEELVRYIASSPYASALALG